MVIDSAKTYLIDLDGTMYKGSQIIPEAITFIQTLQHYHISYVFVTNNAMRTPTQIRTKMEQMGFTGLHDEDFFTSAMAAVSYMKKNHKATRVYYIGEEGLKQAIQAAGYIIDEAHAQLVFVGWIVVRTSRYTQRYYACYMKKGQCLLEPIKTVDSLIRILI